MRKSYFILADGILFPVALYGAMKLNEVIGARAVAYPAEEFCHSPIFSITKKDAILILGTAWKRQDSGQTPRESGI